mgnify:CR=1 FL=1
MLGTREGRIHHGGTSAGQLAPERLAPPRMLRVHALVDSLVPGGAQSLLCELAEVAAEERIELSVAELRAPDGPSLAPRLRAAGVEPTVVGARRLIGAGAARITAAHLAEVRPDILHTHMGYADYLGGGAALRLGIPWISTVHAMHWERSPKERLRTSVIAARRARADRVITVSAAARRAFLADGRVDPEKVVVIPNGIVGDPATGTGAGLRVRLGIAADAPVVAMTAPLRHEKGHRAAFAALEIVLGVMPELRVVVIGDGPDRDEIMELARPLGDAAIFLGHRDDVMTVLDAANVLLHTPETDALPTTLIEAAAAGVPVVATDVGGIPEIVDDGVTGVLLPDGAAPIEVAVSLEVLLSLKASTRRMGIAARERFEEIFRAQRWARRLRELYDEVLGEA